MRIKTLITAALAAALVSGCSNLMVTLGLREAPPPVTDSAYFNAQMDSLLARLKGSQSRPFRKAAVLDFVNSDGRISELGRYMTGKFGERAVAKGYFRVAPPGQIKETLRKLNLVFTGELTRDQAKKIGDALNVDALVTGVVSDLQKGSDVDLNVRVINPS